ncbi:unnamed protein product [Phaedon cochleariae]|uniref:DUF4806 domain-containing protein n=1 Tax=Phaedon cochleariae TaxID=80249 RepID=A0A9P0DMN5_PHACE|nr:unnamed protein product [Phaedon cochleariae]
MLENDDTEKEGIVAKQIQSKKESRVTLPKSKFSQNISDNSTDECMMRSAEEETGESEITPNVDTISSLLDPQINGKLEKLLANQEIIMKNQRKSLDNFNHSSTCQGNQQEIIQQLVTLQTTLDMMASHSVINNRTYAGYQNTLIAARDEIFFEPIDNLTALEKFESKLANKKDMEDNILKFSYVCGRNESGNGINNCYILVDKIFTRKFMTLCSWAGGARDGKEKIPFKMYKNVIGLVFRVVRLSDEDFTLKSCEEFFKAVIRNSTRRSSRKGKQRSKEINYDNAEEDTTKEITNASEEDNLNSHNNIAENDEATVEIASISDAAGFKEEERE